MSDRVGHLRVGRVVGITLRLDFLSKIPTHCHVDDL
jgi:hypothetical protein